MRLKNSEEMDGWMDDWVEGWIDEWVKENTDGLETNIIAEHMLNTPKIRRRGA